MHYLSFSRATMLRKFRKKAQVALRVLKQNPRYFNVEPMLMTSLGDFTHGGKYTLRPVLADLSINEG